MPAINSLAKWGTCGAIGGLIYHTLNDGKGKLITPMGPIDAWMAGAGVAAATSMFSETINAWVLPHVSSNKRLKYAEAHLLIPAVGAAGFAGLSYWINPQVGKDQLLQHAVVGAVAELAGTWVYESVVYPLVDPNDADFQ